MKKKKSGFNLWNKMIAKVLEMRKINVHKWSVSLLQKEMNFLLFVRENMYVRAWDSMDIYVLEWGARCERKEKTWLGKERVHVPTTTRTSDDRYVSSGITQKWRRGGYGHEMERERYLWASWGPCESRTKLYGHKFVRAVSRRDTWLRAKLRGNGRSSNAPRPATATRSR